VRSYGALTPPLTKGGLLMRRTILLVATMALTVLVASGVALAVTKIGGPGPDVLRGTDHHDRLVGRGGPDTLFGLGADDCLLGGTGPDFLNGGPGNDRVLGGGAGCNAIGRVQERPAASDVLNGGPGDDTLWGAAGADVISGGRGDDEMGDGEAHGGAIDTLSGGPGDDFIIPWNDPAGKDLVSCGGGHDEVFADRADVVSGDCEIVHRD
jgi:hypothetical protein